MRSPTTITAAHLAIDDSEYHARCERLLEHAQVRHWRGVVLTDADYIKYYTGFAFIPTERPIVFVLNGAGERVLFVPRLELEHASANSVCDRVVSYDEYPGDPHPTHSLALLLAEMGIFEDFGADNEGYPWILGYKGPKLAEVIRGAYHNVRPFVEDQMAVKSPSEVILIRESVRWASLAHRLLQRYTIVGASETEVADRASREATRAMLDAIGPIYRAQSGMGVREGAFAGYRGQIGRNSAVPHALANDMRFMCGDLLVTGASAVIWGYMAELERTMIIGAPNDAQRRLFDHMLALQDTAFAAMGPGVHCADVDRAVRAYYERNDLFSLWRHHVGHAIGIRYHEGPFLDIGDNTIMQPGMVFTVEPGLYSPEMGGFRHSDTVLITDDGVEILTYYPRDLESLTLPG